MEWQVRVFQKGGTKVVVHQRGLQTPEDGTRGYCFISTEGG